MKEQGKVFGKLLNPLGSDLGKCILKKTRNDVVSFARKFTLFILLVFFVFVFLWLFLDVSLCDCCHTDRTCSLISMYLALIV